MNNTEYTLPSGSGNITAYKTWLFFDEFISYALDDLARERRISKAEMLREFTRIPFGKNIGKCNPKLLLAFGITPDQIALMFDEAEKKAEENGTLPPVPQVKAPSCIKGESVLLEPATQEGIDHLKDEYKLLSGYIDYTLSVDKIKKDHPALTESKLTDLTLILSKPEDKQPHNYIIKTVADSKTVGYLQLMQTDRTTPSVILYIRDDARRRGYGYDALMATITSFKEESVYAALYFVVNAADVASIHLAEKCPLSKKVMKSAELEQFVKVCRIEL